MPFSRGGDIAGKRKLLNGTASGLVDDLWSSSFPPADENGRSEDVSDTETPFIEEASLPSSLLPSRRPFFLSCSLRHGL